VAAVIRDRQLTVSILQRIGREGDICTLQNDRNKWIIGSWIIARIISLGSTGVGECCVGKKFCEPTVLTGTSKTDKDAKCRDRAKHRYDEEVDLC
jgi:hypothetical protein